MKSLRTFRIPYFYLIFLPLFLYILGGAMNLLIMSVNNGQMPVLNPGGCGFWEDLPYSVHVCMTPLTHLRILGDWIHVRGEGFYSLGDLLVYGIRDYWQLFIGAWLGLIFKDCSDKRADERAVWRAHILGL